VAFNDPGGASASGGGLYILTTAGATSGVRIAHSMFGGNVGISGDADIACDTNEGLLLAYTNYFGDDVLSNSCMRSVNVAPVIDTGYTPEPLGDYGGPTLTHPLLPDGPGVHGGSAGGCVAPIGGPLVLDQRGAARSGACDLGSYAP